MPVNNLLKIDPFTRVNDLFTRDTSIDTSPVRVDIKHPAIEFGPNSNETRFQADFYKHIGIDISVETVFNYPYPYISEKSLRAFACKRILIVIGPAGVLEILKAKGFETFDDIINESYDRILDPADRFKTVVNEIHRICSKPLDEIVQYLKNNKKKLDHNFHNLVQLQEVELTQIKKQIYQK